MAKKRTYAQEAKAIMNKYKMRLGDKFDKGDSLSLEAMNQELGALRDRQEQSRAAEEQTAFQQAFENGGFLPMLQNGGDVPWTAEDYRRRAEETQQGFGEIPYGEEAYPYGQYYGDKMGDYLGQFGQGNFNNPQLGVSPYDLVAGRSPQDPLQRGAGANRGITGRPDRPAAQVDAVTGATIPATPPGVAPGDRLGGRGAYGIDDTIYQGGEIPGVTVTPQQQAAQQQAATGGVGGATGAVAGGGPRAYALNDPNDPFSGLSAGPRYQDEAAVQGQAPVQQALPSLDLANLSTAESGGTELGAALGKTPGGADVDVDGNDPFKSRVPWFGAAAQGLASVLGNRQIEFDKVQAQEVTPQEISLAREREGLRRDRDIANSMIRRGAAQGGSRAGLMQNLLAGATGTQRNLGRGLSQSYQTEENTNAQLRNQAGFFNAQQRAIAARGNRENQLINQSRRDAQIGGVGSAITGYGKDLMAAGQYDQMINMLSVENPNYDFTKGKDSLFRKIVQASPDVNKKFLRGKERLSR